MQRTCELAVQDAQFVGRGVHRWYTTYAIPEAASAAYRVSDIDMIRIVIVGEETDLADHLPTEIDIDEHHC